jgi:hypothetical protein
VSLPQGGLADLTFFSADSRKVLAAGHAGKVRSALRALLDTMVRIRG